MKLNKEYQSLGKQSKIPRKYSPAILEAIPNKFKEQHYTVELEAFEFSSICPVTGQPDQGTIHIRYVPKNWLVESKSLKLYLFSFRNVGSFHENVINIITKDLDNILKKPHYLEVFGDFNSRGGIAIYPRVILAHSKKYEKVREERLLLSPFAKKVR